MKDKWWLLCIKLTFVKYFESTVLYHSNTWRYVLFLLFKALSAVNPQLFTIATLTGHSVRAMGPNYSVRSNFC